MTTAFFVLVAAAFELAVLLYLTRAGVRMRWTRWGSRFFTFTTLKNR